MFFSEVLNELCIYSGEIDDSTIGIHVGIKTFASRPEATDSATPYILYVVGTNTERIGTASDEAILSDLLERGYLVSVLDYHGDARATTPALEESIQGIKIRLRNDAEFRAICLGGAECSKAYVYTLPSGYNLTRQLNFWSFDRHGAAGSLDFTISVWNSDFLGVWGNKGIITHPDGRRESVREYTESLPGGKVTEIYQCIKRDGTPIDMNLYMDIIYPTSPKERVPVMMYAQSGQNTVGTWNNPERHHLSGFLFRGYAVALFDYPYIPMSRSDNWGYFDGDGLGSVGGVTGDNYTYSLGTQNNMKSNTAAVRFLRYLAATEGETYRFKVDSFGVIGISKSGNVLCLGHPNPDVIRESRYFEGHHGESRYELGDVEGDGKGEGGLDIIKGGEPQPWLYYPDGTPISPRVQFVYTSVGSGQYAISEGHAPLYSCGTMQKYGSYYRFWPHVVSKAYTYDIPMLYYVCPEVGHSFGIGPDRDTGVDTVTALYEMADVYLKEGAPRCEYVYTPSSLDVSAVSSVSVCFNAAVSEEEIKKITITDSSGKPLALRYTSSYGRTHWELTPEELCDGERYTVTVPDSIRAVNGRTIKEELSSAFTVRKDSVIRLDGAECTTLSHDKPLEITLPGEAAGKVDYVRFFVENDAANVLDAFDNEGTLLGSVNLSGSGSYELRFADGATASNSIILKTRKNSGEMLIYSRRFDTEDMPSEITGETNNVISGELDRDGDGYSLKVEDDVLNTNFAPYHSFYLGNRNIATFRYADDFTEDDYGRRFTFRISIYDTAERQLGFLVGGTVSGEEIDLSAYRSNYTTVPNEWTDHIFRADLKNPRLLGGFGKNNLTVLGEMLGSASREHPLYIDNVSVTETVTDVKISHLKLGLS